MIDGVVDADEYFGSTSPHSSPFDSFTHPPAPHKDKWSNNLSDSEKVLEFFFASCSAAGPSGCAFWAPAPANIRANLTALYDTVRALPIPALSPSESETFYGLFDYPRLRNTVFQALYAPMASFAPLAHGLAALAAGDAGALFALHAQAPYACDAAPAARRLADASTAIFCNDASRVPGGLRWTEEYFAMMARASEFGDIWAGSLIECQ